MALFVNPGKDWEKNMSEEDIAQMESQGYDVTELRAKRAKSTEEEEKERLREKEERENFKNPTNLNKLALSASRTGKERQSGIHVRDPKPMQDWQSALPINSHAEFQGKCRDSALEKQLPSNYLSE